ncbi:putative Cytochrome P450 [Seiridium unicorne]|uniref:Cytochrome P450 n=1 Tax=Seiridium unicorne TaxID=138068 RepID=A0ABR2UH91_9PEZI
MWMLSHFQQDEFVRQGSWALLFALFAHGVFLGVYRLFLSPLAKVPGPKLAAFTGYYESYYEVCLGGQYFKRVAEMHRQYGNQGPIVRVTPNEVHFSDPEAIDTIYPTTGRKTDKPQWFADRTGTPYSIVSTPGHDMHRRRRNALNSFFSVASIRRLEPILHQNIEKMLRRLQRVGDSEDVVQVHRVFKACASDVITSYALNDSFGFLDMEDYGKAWFDSTDVFFFLTHVFAVFPWFVQLVQFTPSWLVEALVPSLRFLRLRQTWWLDRVREIRSSPDPSKVKTTIFAGILGSSLADDQKTDIRLASESQLVIFAGEGTTAYTLTCAIYHLLANPEVARQLKEELARAVPGAAGGTIPDLSQVESLPYLNAVIQEAIRLHPGVMARQVRISPYDPIIYRNRNTGEVYTISPGTVTSMSPLITHMNHHYFEEPYKFDPQRWIDDPSINKWFIGFSRGSRNCVGMTLARREMALIISAIFLKYQIYQGQKGPTIELVNTVRERDIDANADYIIPVPAKGSRGLVVRFRN